MKTLTRIAVLIIAGFALAGCYYEADSGVGSVGITVPDASSTGEPADEELARVYLINGTDLVDISDEDSAATDLFKLVELEFSENEVSIGPVPSGPGYRVVLALGATDEASSVFIPTRYAWTEDEFSVVAGQAVPIELTAVSTPFSYAPLLLGENLVDIAFVGSALYTASASESGSTAYELDLALNITDEDDLTDETAISIGVGAYIDGTTAVPNVPWINTDKGIIPYYAGVLIENWSNDTVAESLPDGTNLPPVLDSGALIAGIPPENDLFGWYQFDGGLGGVYDDRDAGGDKQWVEDIDLSDFITGQPVYDLAVDDSGGQFVGYFASKLGAFSLPQEVLKDTTGDYDSVQEIIDAGLYFDVLVDGEEATITQLSVVDGTPAELYLGTNRGVVSVSTAELATDGMSIPVSNEVTESLGRTVRDMAIGDNYHAILTDNLLIVRNTANTTYAVIPIYAGIVTSPTGIFLSDATGVIYMAGESGLGWVDIDDILDI